MNSIKGILDKSDYEGYFDFLNFQIDGYWLDEKLEELYPDYSIKDNIPTLLFALESEKEQEIVWDRILPKENETTVCPILMCPDDCDFICTLIVAEIENCGSTIRWNKIGFDMTKSNLPEKVGSKVDWFNNFNFLEFESSQYSIMISEFKKHYALDKLRFENIANKNEK